jgi:hypothetical protein
MAKKQKDEEVEVVLEAPEATEAQPELELEITERPEPVETKCFKP